MPRTTDRRVEPDCAALPACPADSDPLLQLQYEAQPPSGPGAVRCAGYSRELAMRGIPVVCRACRARRDWLLINQSRHVWVRCRCSNQWLEPEITRADFDAMLTGPHLTSYPSLEEAMVALGFDGAFSGAYLE